MNRPSSAPQAAAQATTAARVRYTERQILSAADLNDEQAYRLAAQRRHLAGQHRWGIVQGLRLQVVPGGFVIQPGYAVDGFGRELLVPRPVFTPWSRSGARDIFDRVGSETFHAPGELEQTLVDVWLLYASASADPAPHGWQ